MTAPTEGGKRLAYRAYVWREGEDPHWECIGAASTLDDAVDLGHDWAEHGAPVRVDRTIWERSLGAITPPTP